MTGNNNRTRYYSEKSEFNSVPTCREKTKLAVSRLENPYSMAFSDYQMYWEYLEKQAPKTVDEFIRANELRWFPLLVKYKVIKKTNIQKFIDYAQSMKKIDVVSYLMNVTNEFRFHQKEMDIAKKMGEEELAGAVQILPGDRCAPGDLVWMGVWPIPWQVLENRDGKLLLISKFVLDCDAYHYIYEITDWKYSSMRSFLNGSFYSGVFSDREKEQILTVYIDSEDSLTFDGTPDMVADRLFFLNLSEAYRFFKNNEDRRARLTGKARNKIMWTFFDKYAHWWLRTPAVGPLAAEVADKDKDREYYKNLAKDMRGEIGQSYVRVDGEIFTHGGVLQSNSFDKYYEHYGVRPAMYVRAVKANDQP